MNPGGSICFHLYAVSKVGERGSFPKWINSECDFDLKHRLTTYTRAVVHCLLLNPETFFLTEDRGYFCMFHLPYRITDPQIIATYIEV